MPKKPTGVVASPGQLTHYLEELDLSRKELSGMLGVSVRTVHNIEYGRCRVDRGLLRRVAETLNRIARERTNPSSLALTEHNFIREPGSVADVFLRSILVNDCSMLFAGESPIASPDMRWIAAGDQDSIPFAGEYEGTGAFCLIDNLHASIRLDGLEGVEFLRNPTATMVIVRANCNFRHRGSDRVLRFKSFSEIHLKGGHLHLVDTVYDATLMKEFLLSGAPPKLQKSHG